MNNKEYDELVKSVVKKESPVKNVTIAFLSGGFMGILGQYLTDMYTALFNSSINDAYLLTFVTFIVVGSLLTGIGFFDKILSVCKCGLIVPSTGFANAMTSAAMDTNKEGFVKGIGGNIFKLTGSIILYGVMFGLIFGYIRSIML